MGSLNVNDKKMSMLEEKHLFILLYFGFMPKFVLYVQYQTAIVLHVFTVLNLNQFDQGI